MLPCAACTRQPDRANAALPAGAVRADTTRGIATIDAIAIVAPDGAHARVHMTLVNVGPEIDTLQEVISCVSEQAVVTDARAMNADTPLVLAPGDSLHVVPGVRAIELRALSARLAEGDTILVALLFSRAGPVSMRTAVVTDSAFRRRFPAQFARR